MYSSHSPNESRIFSDDWPGRLHDCRWSEVWHGVSVIFRFQTKSRNWVEKFRMSHKGGMRNYPSVLDLTHDRRRFCGDSLSGGYQCNLTPGTNLEWQFVSQNTTDNLTFIDPSTNVFIPGEFLEIHAPWDWPSENLTFDRPNLKLTDSLTLTSVCLDRSLEALLPDMSLADNLCLSEHIMWIWKGLKIRDGRVPTSSRQERVCEAEISAKSFRSRSGID
jgi:hypothetical protein